MVMVNFGIDRPTEIYVRASPVGLGVIRMILGAAGTIIYSRHLLNSTEQRYSPIMCCRLHRLCNNSIYTSVIDNLWCLQIISL